MPDYTAIVELLSGYAFRSIREADVQAAIATLLRDNRIMVEREVRLGPMDIVDFLTPSGLAIEVKIKQSANEVVRQLSRYARHDRVHELILLTTKFRHIHAFPRELNGKALHVVRLQGGFL